MKNVSRWLASIGLDVACLVAGNFAMFLATWAGYEGTASQFWLFRLGLGTTLLLVMGVVSFVIPGEGTVHKWVRFALFELLTIQLAVEFVMRQGSGPTTFDNSLLPLVVDVAVYWMVLSVRHLFVRPQGPSGVSR
jgi:hypothetical protein